MSQPIATVKEIADALGLTESAVRKMADAGVVPKPVRGKMNCLEVLAGWAKRSREQLAAKTNADERIKTARAEKLEIQNAALKRELLPAEEVRRDVTRGFTELKTQLLVIPRRVAQPLAMETDPVIVEERVEKEITAALELMASGQWIEKTK